MNKQHTNRKSLSIKSNATESEKLSAYLAEHINCNNIPAETHNDLHLAAEEIFINIVSYAFTSDSTTTTTVDIEISSTAKTVSVTFIDSGRAFNPLTDCDKKLDNDNLCEGGMGIHLIKSLTDEQEYKRIEQHNVFTVTKHYTNDSNI